MKRGFIHYCVGCSTRAPQKLLFSYVNHRVEEEIPTEYTLTECRRCGGPNLFMREDEGSGFIQDEMEYLWPGDGRDWGEVLPKDVIPYYRSAVEYQKDRKWDATVLEVGRTLEAIVRFLAPEVSGLKAGLDRLRAKGLITEDLYLWADELRVVRNLCAHPSGVTFSEREAMSAFDFLDAIIRVIFCTRRDFEAFKKTRSKAKSA